MEQVDWIPAIAVLGIGVAVGAIVIWRVARQPAATGAAPDERELELRDLRARFDSLLVQLRELEDLAAKRTPEQLAAERRALEIEAAEALRELERRSPEAPAALPASAPAASNAGAAAPPPSGAVKGFLWGAGTMAALALVVFLVLEGSGEREPGGSPTGGSMAPAGAGGGSGGGGAMVDLQGLRRAVEANPDDLDARMDLAQALMIAQDLSGVFEQTRFVLQRNPDHPRALSYESLVRVAMGDLDTALRMANRAVELAPGSPEPMLHLAVVHVQRGESAAAEQVLEEAVRRFPADAPALQALLGELRSRGGTPPPTPPAAAPAGGRGGSIAVRLDLDSAATIRRGIVFVRIIPAGGTRPVAVRRLAVEQFPALVEITDADSMTGRLPERMRVEATLDADGDPATAGGSDRTGSVEGAVPNGSVTVVMR